MSARRFLSAFGLACFAALAIVLTKWGLALSPVKAGLISSPAETPPVEKRVALRYMIWGRENEVRQEREKLEEFVADNPDIQVELVQAGGTGYQIKLATMLAGGVPPDVFMVHEAMFPTLAENELIMPLDDLVAQDPDVDLDDFFPRVVEECRYKGTLYRLPASFNTVVTYYNRDMFDEAGVSYPTDDWTWEDMLAKARALTRRDEDGRTTRYGVMGIGPWLTYAMMMWQNGGEMFDEEDRLVIGKPGYLNANVEALQFCADLQLEEHVHPTEAALDTLPANPFVAGMAAMNLGGTWVNNQIRGRNDFRWDIAPPPRRKERATLVFVGSPVICGATGHPEESWRLLKAMVSEKWQRRIAREGRSLPARKSVAQDLQTPGIPPEVHLGVIFQVVPYGRSQPIGPNVSEWMEQPIADLRDRVLLGSVSGEEITEELLKMQSRFDGSCPYCSTLR